MLPDLPRVTLASWRAQLLAACQSLATALANQRGATVAEVWTYEAWVWENTLSARVCSDWAREVKQLASALAVELDVDWSATSSYTAHQVTLLERWSLLEEDEAADFEELRHVLGFMRLLVKAHRLVEAAHGRLRESTPCRAAARQVGPAYIVPVVTTMVAEMVEAAAHIAGPCHTDRGGEWRARVRAELEDDFQARFEEEVEGRLMGILPPPVPATTGPSGGIGEATDDDGHCYERASSASVPLGALPVGGPSGMFSPDLEEEEEGGGSSGLSGGLPRTPVRSRRPETTSGGGVSTKPSRSQDRTEEAAMASAGLMDPESAPNRIGRLEAQVEQLTAAVNSLMAVAKTMLRPGAADDEKPGADQEDVGAVESLPPRSAPSVEEDVATRKLRHEQRKERLAVFKLLLPWAKHLSVLPDRTPLLRPALHHRYGPPVYRNSGDVSSLDDAVQMFRTMAYPGSPGWGPTEGLLPFRFTPAIALGVMYFRVGGPLRDDEPLYLRTMDFLPLTDGEDRRLAHVNEGMFSAEPTWTERRLPATMADFRDRGLRLAGFLGVHWGARCRHEVVFTVETLYAKGSRSPSLMTPAMACHLLDLLVFSVLEAVYAEAKGSVPPPVGTDLLTDPHKALYATRGWNTTGPTFMASMASSFYATLVPRATAGGRLVGHRPSWRPDAANGNGPPF